MTTATAAIIRAYDNSYINPEKKEKDVFAINVLKTLFLIKYVLEIEANVDNIVSLMITSIDDASYFFESTGGGCTESADAPDADPEEWLHLCFPDR